LGFVAQDVQEVLPEAVIDVPAPLDPQNDDEFKPEDATMLGLDPFALIAHLTETIQELVERVENLEGDES
jgi:hypothetical protein